MTNPLQTIPNLAAAISLAGTEEVWINQAGVDRRTTTGGIAGLAASLISSGNPFIGLANNVSGIFLLPSIALGQADFLTTGYYAVGDAGAALYYHNTGSAQNGDLVSADGVRLTLSLSQSVNVCMFGAKPDDNGSSGTDNLPFFNASLAWSKGISLSGGYALGGPSIFVPLGHYFLSGTLTISHCLNFYGEGTGGAGGLASGLRWPTNTNGIRILSTGTGTNVYGLALQSVEGAVNILYPAIWSNGEITYRDLYIRHWSGAAIYIDGISGISNCWRMDRLFIQDIAHSGILLDGADANAGLSTLVNIIGCDRYGIEDSSFLGNQHLGFQIATCTLGTYLPDNSGDSRSIYSGYTETDCPPGIPAQNDLALGNQYAGVTTGSGFGAYIRGNGFDGGGLYSQGGFGARAATANGLQQCHATMIPGANENSSNFGAFFTGQYTADGGGTYPGALSAYLGAAGAIMGNNPVAYLEGSTFVNGLYFSGSSAAAALYNFGRTNPVPYAINALGGVFIGLGNTARFLDFGAAIPTSGEFGQGDTILNNAPTAGGAPGWTCTTAGAIATSNWAATTAYTLGNLVLNDSGKTYICITAGTSAGSGGPTGTGSNITDGTVHWKYSAGFTFKAQANLAA